MSTTVFEQAPWLRLLRWMVTPSWRRLHFLRDPDAWEKIVEGGSRHRRKAACGVQASFEAPGIGSRMGLERCARCCDALGVPRGKGSGVNAPELVRAAGACDECRGNGEVLHPTRKLVNKKVNYMTCPKCDGSGRAS